MRLRNLYFSLFAAGLCAYTCQAQTYQRYQPDKALLQTISQDFTDGDRQYQLMIKKLPGGRFPKSYDARKNELETSDSGWWCSGFYPGTLLELYAQTHNPALLKEANRMLGLLTKEQYNRDTHDLGFMMYCSFGNALHTEPSPAYRKILVNSAKSLSTRFDPKVGVIRSWNAKKSDYLVIIDNMMNLELLFWATHTTGDSSYYKIAVAHADKTIKNHFRPDYSSYHVVNYDPDNGSVQERKTAQGYANESAWARGQAWGLYGYTVMYRETHQKKYLDQANRIANFILNNPHLPADKIPYWDFNAPGEPHVLRDASAAAVIASGLLELCRYTNAPNGQRYFNIAGTILKNLSSAPYLAAPGTNGGFMLQHSVGNLPSHTEVDVPLTYADYYFVQALGRYRNFAKP